MDTVHIFLQHYWWFIISLLGALLVFLLFVQGGQAMLYTIGRTETERNLIVNSLGRKWELTFTTLVTFGGAFFASFPLFYSTSFGGAFYVWMLILLVFVIQAVSYEYRRKPSNFLGEKTLQRLSDRQRHSGDFPARNGRRHAVLRRAVHGRPGQLREHGRIQHHLAVGHSLGTDSTRWPTRATFCWDWPFCSFRAYSACSTS